MRTFEENLFNFLLWEKSPIYSSHWVLCDFLQQAEKNSPQQEKKIITVSFPPYAQIIKKLLNLQLRVSVVRLHKVHVHVQPAENGLDKEI